LEKRQTQFSDATEITALDFYDAGVLSMSRVLHRAQVSASLVQSDRAVIQVEVTDAAEAKTAIESLNDRLFAGFVGLCRPDIFSLPALRHLGEIEFHCLAFLQAFEPARLDGAYWLAVRQQWLCPLLKKTNCRVDHRHNYYYLD
jgi:hypothetical protein